MIQITIAGFTIGSLVSCYANYYIFDLKDDSFILPVPVMYVLLNDVPIEMFE